MSEPKKCCARVRNEYGCGSRACHNKAKVEVDGKHYCGIHDPAKEKARADKRDAESTLRLMGWRLEDLRRECERTLADIGRAVVNGIPTDTLVAGYHANKAKIEEHTKAIEDYKNANNL